MNNFQYNLNYIALSLKVIGVIPAGALKTFCEPVYNASISHLSANNGTLPKEATASTANKQLYLQQQISY